MNHNSLVGASDDLIKALKTCDQKKLNELIADNYQGFSLRGTIETKETILGNFKPGCITFSKYILTDVDYEVFDQVGIVTGKGKIAGTYGEYEFEHTVLFTDIFTCFDEKWIYYKSQVTEIPGQI